MPGGLETRRLLRKLSDPADRLKPTKESPLDVVQGKIDREEFVGTALLFMYALAPSRTSIFALSLLSNLPHEQDKVGREVRENLIDLFDEKTQKVDPKKVGVWLTALDEVDNLKRCVR